MFGHLVQTATLTEPCPPSPKRTLCRLLLSAGQGHRAVPVLDGLKCRPDARFAGYRVAGGCCADAASPTPSPSGPTSRPPHARSPAPSYPPPPPTAHPGCPRVTCRILGRPLAEPAISETLVTCPTGF